MEHLSKLIDADNPLLGKSADHRTYTLGVERFRGRHPSSVDEGVMLRFAARLPNVATVSPSANIRSTSNFRSA